MILTVLTVMTVLESAPNMLLLPGKTTQIQNVGVGLCFF